MNIIKIISLFVLVLAVNASVEAKSKRKIENRISRSNVRSWMDQISENGFACFQMEDEDTLKSISSDELPNMCPEEFAKRSSAEGARIIVPIEVQQQIIKSFSKGQSAKKFAQEIAKSSRKIFRALQESQRSESSTNDKVKPTETAKFMRKRNERP